MCVREQAVQTPGQAATSNPVLIPLATEALFSDELLARIRAGHRCVRFEYCVSVGVVTFRRLSAVYLTTDWRDRYVRGAGYSLLALLLGPWGVPWGPVWTARAVWTNLTGGDDVTDDVTRQLAHEPTTLPSPHRP